MGVYTPLDYANIFGHMIEKFDLEHLSLSPEADIARNHVIKLHQKHRERAEMIADKTKKGLIPAPEPESFSYIIPQAE